MRVGTVWIRLVEEIPRTPLWASGEQCRLLWILRQWKTTLLDSDSKVLLTLNNGEELILKDEESLTLDALRKAASSSA